MGQLTLTAEDLFKRRPNQCGRYATLYADPPWPERGGGKIKRGADRHYALMSVADISAMPFGEWAAWNAHLYLWVTNNYLPAGLECVKAWGFRYVTMVTWVKDRAGLGQYYRGRTEHCLFAVRGRLPYKTHNDGKRAQGETVIYEPEELPGCDSRKSGEQHSVKPGSGCGRIIESGQLPTKAGVVRAPCVLSDGTSGETKRQSQPKEKCK